MKLLSVLAVLIILAGMIGAVTKDVKRRMLGVSLTVVGMLLLANVQGGVYGVFAGVELLLFQLPTLILFLIAFGSLCKKNKISQVDGFVGFRRSHPWVLLLFLIMGVILIGIPGTGTFGAYMIEINAILEGAASGVGVFQLISLLGMIVGIISLGIQFFDIWIHMMLMDDRLENTDAAKEDTEAEEAETLENADAAKEDTEAETVEEAETLENTDAAKEDTEAEEAETLENADAAKEDTEAEEAETLEKADVTKEVSDTEAETALGLNKALLGIEGVLLMILVILGVFQTPVMAVISLIYQALK